MFTPLSAKWREKTCHCRQRYEYITSTYVLTVFVQHVCLLCVCWSACSVLLVVDVFTLCVFCLLCLNVAGEERQRHQYLRDAEDQRGQPGREDEQVSLQ